SFSRDCSSDVCSSDLLLREIESGPQGAAARRLRQEWEAPSFHLDPPRPFRHGETPAVNLHARNVDVVEVLLHHVDLEAVFLAARSEEHTSELQSRENL